MAEKRKITKCNKSSYWYKKYIGQSFFMKRCEIPHQFVVIDAPTEKGRYFVEKRDTVKEK